MTLEKAAFTRYHEEKKADTFTIWLNKEERALLEEYKKVLEQEKDGTALKQLAWIGADLLGRPEISRLLGTVFKNKQKNKRLGIGTFDPDS